MANTVPVARPDFGGLAWWCRCRRQSVAVKGEFNMRVPKWRLHYKLFWSPHLWSCFMWISPGIEMTMELEWHIVNVLVFCDHFTWDMSWHMWLLIRWQKLLLNFYGKATSWSSEHWPSSWVTEGPPLRATSSVSCVSSWAFKRWELCHTTPRPMDRWSQPTKHWCGWLGNWVKIRRQTGLSISQNWCMLTTPWDWPSLGTAHITWCLGDDCACPLLFLPLLWAQKNTSMSITTLLTYVSDCVKPSRKHKCSPHLRLKGRDDTMIIRPMPFHWNQVTWSWQNLIPTKGGEKWKTGGRRNHMKWNAGLLKASLHTSWRTSRPDTHESFIRIDFFSSPL